MLRRTFLASAAAPLAVPAAAQSTGIRLGIDAYSIRNWGWKAPQLLEWTVERKLDVCQFSGLRELESYDNGYLGKLRSRAAEARVDLELGLGSICPTSTSWKGNSAGVFENLKTAFAAARGMNARIIKAYVGSSTDRNTPGVPIGKHIEETLKILKQVRSQAVDGGVKIAMENHSGDLTARELRALIEEAGKDWVGCCLDSGNPMMTLEDPVLTLEILGPYAITTHIRDSVLFEHPRGAAWQWVALGDGTVDWSVFMQRYSALCPKAAFLLENITGRPPRIAAYLEQEFWKPFPNVLSSDFATYVAMAKRGRPLMESMIVADLGGQQPAEYREALKRQQMLDLEKGLEFARRKLNIGINWRS